MTLDQRFAHHLAPIIIAGRTIKRYHLCADPTPMPPGIAEAAYRYVPHLVPAFTPGEPHATVTVLHQTSPTQAHLNAYSWRGHGLVHCRTATGDAGGFARTSGPVTGCVWELPVVMHERAAFHRHMLSSPGDIDAYLADALTRATADV
jgi:hypothetical protein